MTNFRYSDFKYGDRRYTGDRIPLTWYVGIDWDGDGYFEADENDRLLDLNISRGRSRLLTSDGSGEAGMARSEVGTLAIMLDNYDRRFSFYYTSSPLYPNILPGREIRVRVTAFNTTTYDVFRGKIDDIEPAGKDKVVITATDGWQLLSDQSAVTQLRTSTTGDVVIGDILTAVDWPAAWGRNLDTGTDTLLYGWADGDTAYDVIHEINDVEQGTVYVGGDGKFYFENRGNLLGTSADLTLYQKHVSREVRMTKPWTNVRNHVSVTHLPRVVASTATLWQLKDTPGVAASDSLTLWARFTDSNGKFTPAQNVATPVATTDYTMNSASDGSGTDMTSDFTVVMTTYAGRAKLVLTNNGSTTGYVTLLKVRGDAIEAQDTVVSISEDSTSQITYGLRELRVDNNFLQQTSHAQNLAGALLAWLQEPSPRLIVAMENIFALQFGYDIGTIVQFVSDYYDIDASFRLVKIIHQSLNSLQAMETRWVLESLPTSTDVWKLGVVGHSELGTTTYVVY